MCVVPSCHVVLVYKISTQVGKFNIIVRKRQLSDTKFSLFPCHKLCLGSVDFMTKGSLNLGHMAIKLTKTIG